MIAFTLSTRIEGNPRGSPQKLRRLAAEARKRAHLATLAHLLPKARFACDVAFVNLVRLYRAPRGKRLDGHDNLRAGCKPTVDGVTDGLGLKSDAGLQWDYAQEPGPAYGVRVEIHFNPRAVRP